MSTVKIDAQGLRCPEPIVKLAVMAAKMKEGGIIEISGDCSTFEADIRIWTKRMQKAILEISEVDGVKVMKIKI